MKCEIKASVLGAVLTCVMLSTCLAGTRELDEFAMVDFRPYLESFPKNAKVSKWLKQLRNAGMFPDGCKPKAMALAFREAMPERPFQRMGDRSANFQTGFPRLRTPANPSAPYQCMVMVIDPQAKTPTQFEYNDKSHAIEFAIHSRITFSEPYNESRYIGQNAFGASAGVDKYDRNVEVISFVDTPPADAPLNAVAHHLNLDVSLKMDRGTASNLVGDLRAFVIGSLETPFFAVSSSNSSPTISNKTDVTFYEYKIYIRPTHVVVSSFFPATYFRLFDLRTCRKPDLLKSERPISEDTCKFDR